MRIPFVTSVLKKLISQDILSLEDSVLCVCADKSEQAVFLGLGFKRVTIANADVRQRGGDYIPYDWSFQDSQQLTFKDRSFDVVFVSDGLHHCRSPHKALVEMVRTARKAVVVFESRDNLLMRVANRFGLSPEYELEAVICNNWIFGGMDNTAVPNYIYRWTEREFSKTVNSFLPHGPNRYHYFYALNLPYEVAKMSGSAMRLLLMNLARPFVWLLTLVAPGQCNSFCMVAQLPQLPRDLWPWLREVNGKVEYNKEYVHGKFKQTPVS